MLSRPAGQGPSGDGRAAKACQPATACFRGPTLSGEVPPVGGGPRKHGTRHSLPLPLFPDWTH
jgi:hypothetical protein